MPRELTASMLQSCTSHHLSQSTLRLKRRKNKRARFNVTSQTAQKLSLSNDIEKSAVSSLERAGHGSIAAHSASECPAHTQPREVLVA